MLTQASNIAVIHRADQFSPCIQYVLDLFCQTYGHCYRLIPADLPEPALDVAIYYGVEPSGSSPKSLSISRSHFFNSGFGTSTAPPPGIRELIDEAKGHRFTNLLTKSRNSLHLKCDVFASAFYLLSGYHDWVTTKRDQHGRVLAADIDLPPETWDLPVVNHWLRQLNELLNVIMTGEVPDTPSRPSVPGQQTICLTHDVDLLRKYSRSSLPRHFERALKGGTAAQELKRARAVLGGRERDPYDSIEQFYTVKERVSAQSTFFFMGSAPSSRNGDYRVSDRAVKEIIIRAKTFGDEIGLHGSWESAERPELIQREKDAVEKAAGVPVQGNRQHYLRFQNPKTWQGVTKAGLRYDATGGFPDRCGFKYGWSGCFKPFDLEAMKPHEFYEIPLVCMDVTLAAYEKIPAELALERLTNLLDASCENVPGGAFTFLWHNTMGDKVAYPGYWDTFEYFFSVASGSARFITLSQLCDEADSRTHG